MQRPLGDPIAFSQSIHFAMSCPGSSNAMAPGAASCNMTATVERVAAKVNTMIAECEAQAPAGGGLKRLTDEALALLEREGLAYRQQVAPQFVGVHPNNRWGDGLVPVDVHDLVELILKTGWSWSEVGKAMAAELPPGELGAKYAEFNDSLAKSSGGLLPQVKSETLQLLSFSCSHTNAGLHAIKAGARALHSTVADSEQRLSLARLAEREPEMARACHQGLHWLVLRWQIEVACPNLLTLLQQSANLAQVVARQETDVQCLLQVHALATKMGSAIDWESVAKQVSNYRPDIAGQVADFCEFVRVWSGGPDAPILKEIDSYIKGLDVKRKVRGSILAAFAKAPLAQAALYVQARVGRGML